MTPVRWERLAWPALLLFSLTARLADLGHRALSHDESLHSLYSWYLSNGLNYRHDPMMHGPLLFHLNGLLLALAPATDFLSRLVPALLGAGCVALLWLYRRWLGRAGAWWAAALVSLEPALLYYSRYLRNDIYISFFTLLMVWALLRYREERRPEHLLWLAGGLALSFVTKENCFIHGAVLGSGCVLFALVEAVRGGDGWFRSWWTHPLMEGALAMLTLALPFAGALLHPLFGWDPLDNQSLEGQTRIGAVALAVFGLSTAAAIPYFHARRRLRTWLTALGLFWLVQAMLYTTLFTNVRHGLASGLAGSLGYWLAQHEVKRGNPDPFFYVTLLLLYAPVLIAGAVWAVGRLKTLPILFFLWWTLGNLAVYSWAGERMPWLLPHTTLPLCLLTGAALPGIFRPGPAGVGRWGLRLVFALGLLHLAANSLRLNGPNAEGPREPLVYAHSGPQVKTAVRLVRRRLETHPDTRIQSHANYTWPLAWYFREMPVDYTPPEPGEIADDISVILVPPRRREEFVRAGWVPRLEVDMTTWPRPHYHRISRENLRNVLQKPPVRSKLLRYYLFRDQPGWRPGEWPGPSRFLLMTRGGGVNSQ